MEGRRAIEPSYPQEDYKEEIISEWPFSTVKINQIRQERVYNYRERDMIKEPVESGLWGSIWFSAIKTKERY